MVEEVRLELVSHHQSVVSVLQMVAQHDMGARTVFGESHIVEVVGSFAARAVSFSKLVYGECALNERLVVTGGTGKVESYGLHHTRKIRHIGRADDKAIQVLRFTIRVKRSAIGLHALPVIVFKVVIFGRECHFAEYAWTV